MNQNEQYVAAQCEVDLAEARTRRDYWMRACEAAEARCKELRELLIALREEGLIHDVTIRLPFPAGGGTYGISAIDAVSAAFDEVSGEA